MRGDDENKAVGLSVQKYLKDIGIDSLITPMEKIQLYKENGEKKGDLTLLTWYLDSESILNFLDPVFSSTNPGNGGNRSFYKNTLIQADIEKFRNGMDIKKNQNVLRKIFNTIEDDAPWIFLWSIDENYIISKKASQYPELPGFL